MSAWRAANWNALNDREHVIEVMRNTGGELADGFHLLRLTQLRSKLSRSVMSSM